MKIDGIEVIGDIPEDEAREYVKRAPLGCYEMKVTPLDDYIDIEYHYAKRIPFERISRITGYLVGSLDRFNDAKLAEVNDRVKHEVSL